MERTSKDHLSASALWVGAKAEGIDSLELKVLPQAIPRLPPEHVLVEVHAAAVNQGFRSWVETLNETLPENRCLSSIFREMTNHFPNRATISRAWPW